MNYAVAIFGLIMIFALLYWQFVGKKTYTGPVDETVQTMHGIEQTKTNQSMVSPDAGKEEHHANKHVAV